ncbi:hypothetical protein KC19_12G082400 [Ceratodon purpureus]|uniref:Uncharacterized protein n=1 Tax=Ceratodon purpureus TaxID=3225 RepID=A0A8T0G5X1_CERPU|nr:hypothetical protein KC19_12G082400 [Ceratodon purpureus]
MRVSDVSSKKWDNFKMRVKRPALQWHRSETRQPEMNTYEICADVTTRFLQMVMHYMMARGGGGAAAVVYDSMKRSWERVESGAKGSFGFAFGNMVRIGRSAH